MQSATLDEFTAWNDQLLALAEAGVPLDVGLRNRNGDAAATLKQINATVARRVQRGETLGEALDDDEPIVPAEYRSLVEVGIQSGDLPAGLVESGRIAGSIDESRYAFRAALVYPLIVCGMAYVGLVSFCLFFVPTLERVSHGLRIPLGSVLQYLQVARETLPMWVAIPPIIFLIWILVTYRNRKHQGPSANLNLNSNSWIPGMSQVVFQERCANFAEMAAKLIDCGTPLDEALQLAADAAGDPRLTSRVQTADAKQILPFLRWALWHSEPAVDRARALQMAADIYRQSAQRRAARLRMIVPIVLSVVLGGTATLLFGLALFLPVVQLLGELAS